MFVDRCPLVDETCRTLEPPETPVGLDGNRFTRCHHPDRIAELAEEPPDIDIGILASSELRPDVLELSHVSKTFRQRNVAIPALVDIGLNLATGETLGIVGESGSAMAEALASVCVSETRRWATRWRSSTA